MEIYQNCPIFNDGAFDAIKDNDTKADAIIPLRARRADPVRQPTASCGVVRDPATGGVQVVEDADVRRRRCWSTTRTPTDPTTAFALSRLTDAGVLTRRRSGSSGRSSARRTTTRPASRSPPPARAPTTAPRRSPACSAAGDTWTVV